MKTHTTNYQNTFITVAEDTRATAGTTPPSKSETKTLAEQQYNLLASNPYRYTSDDILFLVFADRNNLALAEYDKARELFFSKGQPCLRTSPHTKTYGFGVHSNSKGKIALYGMETEDYQKFLADETVKKFSAMRSTKK